MLTNDFYIHYNVTGEERRRLVNAISDYMETDSTYLGVPTFDYQVDYFTIDRNGCVSFDDRADSEEIEGLLEHLENQGFEPDDTPSAPDFSAEEEHDDEPGDSAEPEPISLTVSVPMKDHTGRTLRNLLNLVYTRAELLNRSLGTSFRVEEGLKDALQGLDVMAETEEVLRVIADYGDTHGASIEGMTMTPDTITFASLPETSDGDVIRAFTEVVGMMNRQALTQMRIQAKTVDDANEKYALRIWLTRLGMNGSEYKVTRKVLMRNLSGNSAFRTDAERDRWMRRQKERRAAADAEGGVLR